MLSDERIAYVLESLNPATMNRWVVEDLFSAADLAEEQRVWAAGHYPSIQFRVVRYVPETPDRGADR